MFTEAHLGSAGHLWKLCHCGLGPKTYRCLEPVSGCRANPAAGAARLAHPMSGGSAGIDATNTGDAALRPQV